MADPIFVTLGMFIIDEIHFPDKPSQLNVIGGGGTYGAVGARFVLLEKDESKVGWFIDLGNDFPTDVETQLKKWKTGAIWRRDHNRKTTRGWNMYGENELRLFEYKTPKLRIDVPDLVKHEPLIRSKSFHLVCSPERCLDVLAKLDKARPKNIDKPVIVWEPIPDECKPENWEKCVSVLPEVCVFSPNAAEAASFFQEKEPFCKRETEILAKRFIKYMSRECGVVLRCGAKGCFVVTTEGYEKWFPAYHEPGNSDYKVVDPTGGGNTFIGAFAAGFIVSGRKWDMGCMCGSVGSGIAIEQIGMPILGDHDTWNGKSFQDRLSLYIERHQLGDTGSVLRGLYQ